MIFFWIFAIIATIIAAIIYICSSHDEGKNVSLIGVIIVCAITFAGSAFIALAVNEMLEGTRQGNYQRELSIEQANYHLYHFINEQFDGYVPSEMWYLPRNASSNFSSARVTDEFYRTLYVRMAGQDLGFSINHARRAIETQSFDISTFLTLQ